VNGRDILSGVPGVVVKRLDTEDTGDGTRREEVRVQVVKSGDTTSLELPLPSLPGHFSLPPIPSLPGASVMRFESTAKLGKGVTASLGTKDFDGVKAEGKSTTWTIPAGEVGNRNPIQVVSESWYAPELKVTVYSRYSDPRQGESIYRLTGIRRGEPPADLFKVPEGWDTKGSRAKREERG
jgi:hypothetical protein